MQSFDQVISCLLLYRFDSGLKLLVKYYFLRCSGSSLEEFVLATVRRWTPWVDFERVSWKGASVRRPVLGEELIMQMS